MQKGKVNITMDKDLIEYAKAYAEEQRNRGTAPILFGMIFSHNHQRYNSLI